MSLGDWSKKRINRLLALNGLVIKRVTDDRTGSALGYISAMETVAAAEREGLSVCDYVERLWDQQGDTKFVVDQMESTGALSTPNAIIVEIGAGTGRYLEKILQRCNPLRYESYETARDWADWLQTRYPIISHAADGESLNQTPNGAADLVHVHGVFVYLPFLVTYRYWMEMWRVAKVGGHVVFDIYSEDCMDASTVKKWLESTYRYPCFMCKNYAVSEFERNGFSLVHSFTHPHGLGRSEYVMFTRKSNGAANPVRGA